MLGLPFGGIVFNDIAIWPNEQHLAACADGNPAAISQRRKFALDAKIRERNRNRKDVENQDDQAPTRRCFHLNSGGAITALGRCQLVCHSLAVSS